MKRRNAIRSLTMGIGGLMSFPAWANSWTPAQLDLVEPLLMSDQEEILVEMVATIIPEGQIPGAKSLGVPAFIQKMLTDCYESSVQDNFAKGLTSIQQLAQQQFNKPFAAGTASQKLDLLKSVESTTNAELKSFFTLLKNLTIQGYTTSEYVMVNHLNYVMAPGHYYGCVPVKS
ncbi:MAG: gluconate 2-dehydrogenase subunit 3 family protein [Spirosomataceae bacterium]